MLKWCGFGSKKSAEDAAPAAAAAPSVAGRRDHSAGSPSRASVRVSDALEAVRAPLPSSQPSDAVVEERFLELLHELGLPPAARTAMLAQSVEQKWRMVCARQVRRWSRARPKGRNDLLPRSLARSLALAHSSHRSLPRV